MKRRFAGRSTGPGHCVRSRPSFALLVLALATCGWLSAAAQAAETPPKPAPAAKAPKSTLRLKAKFIVFDLAKGNVELDGEVHVTRTTGEQVLTIDCDKMKAKLKDGKMESVVATGSVRLATEDIRATAAKADFDFSKNIITLYGTKEKPASMTSQKPPRIVSTGPTIIFHVDEQRVEMNDGITEIPLESGSDEKKTEK